MAKILQPAYYQNFSCLGGECKYTCCQEWNIKISRAEYNKIRGVRASEEINGIIENAFKRNRVNGSDDFYAFMALKEDGYCPFLLDNGWCKLHSECGERILPEICKIFPRITSELLGYHQRICSEGCEQTVKLLLEEKDGLSFVEVEDANEKSTPIAVIEKSIGDKKSLYRWIADVQAVCIGILQNRVLSLSDRMILLGIALQDFDISATLGDVAMEDWVKRRSVFATPDGAEAVRQSLQKFKANSQIAVFNTLRFMNISVSKLLPTDSFVVLVNEINKAFSVIVEAKEDEMLFNYKPEKFEQAVLAYKENLAEYEYLFENIVVNRFFFEFLRVLKDYTAADMYSAFCYRYTIMRIMVLGGIAENANVEALVNAVTRASRGIYHNTVLIDYLIDEMRNNKVDNLAHMAALIKSCDVN